ncbi:Histidine kinase-, DNA gyrase B-, and HSP90-like ATPase [Mariprofundus ferrinatatus]|uniref:Histidine kinase-, DNA gyrase B-, and HSP90-like ATPase n=1 Tax=Mariprofundus ferrinatatus TaxID=1921087 RepID=A0A2K8L318_9PROT|nr:ATP-binding protein [Mariprofundus ferrinatatus]ATX81730.1 Histidine kinase-, DNA gyrase B-, and HSP90-like ATPase [Mariprofundus ferrinatatus]
MANALIPAKTAIQTFRDAGYKNTASAVAELIDNSIEAKAKDIQIITFEEAVFQGARTTYRINELAVYDDGGGMPPSVLEICLQFGNGTRLSSRSGIGRFGIGLPNASVSQAKRIDVYSWQNNECYHTYLDVDEVSNGDLDEVNPVTRKELPQEWKQTIEGGVQESGTLIVWSKCDRLDMARSRTLFTTLSKDLCRIYRHFLDDDNSYGKKVKIRLVEASKEMLLGNMEKKITPLQANDPLYLMTPNNIPEFETKKTNMLHGNIVSFPVRYNEDGDTANVEIRFSIALPETQTLGGGSLLGQHYRRNTGISFMRAAREIDFGTFGYFNSQDERERWWGCEIRFEPKLDELFGVTNNKQAVRGVHYIDEKEFKKEHADDWEDMLKDDLKLLLRMQLSKYFYQNHKEMWNIIKGRGAGKRGDSAKERAASDKSTRIANQELEGLKTPTRSAEIGQKKSGDEKVVEWRDRLLESDSSLLTDEAAAVAKEKVDLIIEKDFSAWPGSQFFSIEIIGGTCVLVINRKHPFFSDLYEPIMDADDDKYIEALDLVLMAYARMEDELYSRNDELDEIRDIWGRHLKTFLLKLKDEA